MLQRVTTVEIKGKRASFACFATNQSKDYRIPHLWTFVPKIANIGTTKCLKPTKTTWLRHKNNSWKNRSNKFQKIKKKMDKTKNLIFLTKSTKVMKISIMKGTKRWKGNLVDFEKNVEKIFERKTAKNYQERVKTVKDQKRKERSFPKNELFWFVAMIALLYLYPLFFK